MTRSRLPHREDERAARLRVLTRLTVLAWVTALGLSVVPVVAGGAGAGAVTGSTGLDGKPEKTTAAPTAKVRPTPKPKPRATPTAQPTATAQPSPRAHPTSQPPATPAVTASPTPRPSHGNGGGRDKPSPSPSPDQGGVVSAADGNGGADSGKTGSGGSRGGRGDSGSGSATSAPAPFSVPGSVPGIRSRDQAGGGSESLFDGVMFLDFDLASSIDILTPAALLALPGLLIVLSLVAQVAGGLLWIPMTRRLLAEPSDPLGGQGARRG
jgi:hypothetical protein